jgi:hypothetical protein
MSYKHYIDLLLLSSLIDIQNVKGKFRLDESLYISAVFLYIIYVIIYLFVYEFID